MKEYSQYSNSVFLKKEKRKKRRDLQGDPTCLLLEAGDAPHILVV